MKKQRLKELKGFEKTSLLQPGEEEIVTLSMMWKDMAFYEEELASWGLPVGIYTLYTGNSAVDVEATVNVIVKETIIVEKVSNRLSLAACNVDKIDFLKTTGNDRSPSALYRMELTAEEVLTNGTQNRKGKPWAKQFETAREKAENVVKELSVEQLAAMCVGFGAGTPFGAFNIREDPYTINDADGKPLTENDHPTGFQGYVSPAIREKGIPSIFYKDGPAGIGTIAWQTEMLCACAFNKEL